MDFCRRHRTALTVCVAAVAACAVFLAMLRVGASQHTPTASPPPAAPTRNAPPAAAPPTVGSFEPLTAAAQQTYCGAVRTNEADLRFTGSLQHGTTAASAARRIAASVTGHRADLWLAIAAEEETLAKMVPGDTSTYGSVDRAAERAGVAADVELRNQLPDDCGISMP